MSQEFSADELRRLESECDDLTDRLAAEVRTAKPRAEMIPDLVRLRLLMDEIDAQRRVTDPERDGSE